MFENEDSHQRDIMMHDEGGPVDIPGRTCRCIIVTLFGSQSVWCRRRLATLQILNRKNLSHTIRHSFRGPQRHWARWRPPSKCSANADSVILNSVCHSQNLVSQVAAHGGDRTVGVSSATLK